LAYHTFGLFAVVGQIFHMGTLFALLSVLGGALTLPGIAGAILSLGMAVDANVLIYERIREELSNGKTVRSAVDAGFKRAFVTIMDSNITTLIAAVVLFQFGTGPLKGFAVTLSIGILASLFSAVFVSRTVFDLILTNRKVTGISV
ncbi:MAG: MMPL family transporter, partial [Nitrospinae bacterium]|nr:MMPL family transporter [Nitrospinota bacterium]